MIVALSNTGLELSFDEVLVLVLALNLVVLFTLTFAPGVHNRITDWIFHKLFDGSRNRQK